LGLARQLLKGESNPTRAAKQARSLAETRILRKGESKMSTQFANYRSKPELVSDRMFNTRAHWSRDERQRRAQVARKRQAELWSLLSEPVHEPEIWAVGAASIADIVRIEN
jgi:hypothetical protein